MAVGAGCTALPAPLSAPSAAAIAAATDEGDRLKLVLLGSFVGARCQPVADALRVCYEEYSPLRFGGDIIFRVLKRVVASMLRSG